MGEGRYTRELLQAEADGWAARLSALGLDLPARLVVCTSVIDFMLAGGRSDGIARDLGRIGWARDETPLIYISVRKTLADGKDPRYVLLHELTHHHHPRLPHEVVYEISDLVWSRDESIADPADGWQTGVSIEDLRIAVTDVLRRYRVREARFEEYVQGLWLEANGLDESDDDVTEVPLTADSLHDRKDSDDCQADWAAIGG